MFGSLDGHYVGFDACLANEVADFHPYSRELPGAKLEQLLKRCSPQVPGEFIVVPKARPRYRVSVNVVDTLVGRGILEGRDGFKLWNKEFSRCDWGKESGHANIPQEYMDRLDGVRGKGEGLEKLYTLALGIERY